MSFLGAAGNEAGRQAVRKAFGDGQPKPATTRQEAEQELTRGENWRLVSAPVAFAGGYLVTAAVGGAAVAAPVAGVIFGGLAVASWLERRRARQARARAVRGRA